VTTVVEEGSEPSHEALILLIIPFNTSAAGTIDVTVDWTFEENDLDIYVARGMDPCSLDDFNARVCEWVALSESFTDKPETLTASNAAAGQYTLYVANWGPGDESSSWQVVLTTSGVASTGSARQAARGAETPGKGTLTLARTAR
jgi:hypothetical protein